MAISSQCIFHYHEPGSRRCSPINISYLLRATSNHTTYFNSCTYHLYPLSNPHTSPSRHNPFPLTSNPHFYTPTL